LVLTILFVSVMVVFTVYREREKKNSECNAEHVVFISDTIKCPDEKQFIHVHVIGKSTQILCCSKE